MLNKKIFILSLVWMSAGYAKAQTLSGQNQNQNPIVTAVPFLGISPDARHGGMGDLGAATSPDANAVYWNPSKLVFAEEKLGFALSYTPWLRNLVNDMYIMSMMGYRTFKQKNGITASAGGSFRYFNLGELYFTNIQGVTTGQFIPREFALDGFYGLQLSRRFGMAVSLRYIYSNLAGTISNNSLNSRPANTAAGDISAYWQNEFVYMGRKNTFSLGANLGNIGPKITYATASQNNFIPTILRLGFGLGTQYDQDNHVALYGDINKLVVPTPNPSSDTASSPAQQPSLLAGMFGSFTDAPGGLTEELREIFYSAAIEYSYQKKFMLRAGLFRESRYKGRRQYLTFGVGLRLTRFGVDFSYLTSPGTVSPLDDTIRFTVYLNLGDFVPDKPLQQSDDTPPGETK